MKRRFGYSIQALVKLSEIDPAPEKYPFLGTNHQALSSIGLLMFNCFTYGQKITDGQYRCQNPCRNQQYRAEASIEPLQLNGIFESKNTEPTMPLADELSAFLDQCDNCPYRFNEPDESEKKFEV